MYDGMETHHQGHFLVYILETLERRKEMHTHTKRRTMGPMMTMATMIRILGVEFRRRRRRRCCRRRRQRWRRLRQSPKLAASISKSCDQVTHWLRCRPLQMDA